MPTARATRCFEQEAADDDHIESFVILAEATDTSAFAGFTAALQAELGHSRVVKQQEFVLLHTLSATELPTPRKARLAPRDDLRLAFAAR